MMQHLWSCLSGLSSPFSPTRRPHEWLICMWTRAFTSVPIETAVACHRVAWFPCAYRGAVKNRRDDKSFYPYAALRRPLKHCLFMYNRETFKIIGFFLVSPFFPSLHTRPHTHTHSSDLWRKSQVIIMQSFHGLESFELCSIKRENFSGEFHLCLLIDDIYR